jgi:hypothetical protein
MVVEKNGKSSLGVDVVRTVICFYPTFLIFARNVVVFDDTVQNSILFQSGNKRQCKLRGDSIDGNVGVGF